MPTQLDRIEERIESIHNTLHGDGSESKPGLVVRVDRVEQTHKLAKWLTATTVGAAITSIVAAVKSGLHN